MARPEVKRPEAVERSTFAPLVTFTDSAGQPVTPDSVRWSLSTLAGAIVNGRSLVVATPAPALAIVLSGADLQLLDGEIDNVGRLLTVQATYTSTEGAGLPLNEEIHFELRGLKVVTA